jgi:hypothetical protein
LRASAPELIRDRREAEVHDDHLAALVRHDVLRFKSRWIMPRSWPPQVPRKSSGPSGSLAIRSKRGRIDIFHRDERSPVNLAKIVNTAYLRMRYLPRQRLFAAASISKNLSVTDHPSVRSLAR